MNGQQHNEENELIECCVCMRQESDDLPALKDDITGELLGLGDLPDNSHLIDLLRGNASAVIMFKGSCQSHAICNACLHYLATSFGSNHPIGPMHPMIRCPYPFKNCLTPLTGLPNYFPHSVVEKVLTADEQQLYVAHAHRYQFPGFELVQCPRPSRYGTTCGAGILVSLDDVREAITGRLILRCDQSQLCQRQTCYHCKGLVHRSRDYCDYCLTSIENINPKLYNYYFHRVDKRAGDGQHNLYRNEEITDEIVYQQLRDILSTERLEVRCTECLTFMFKTELCNTLEHCGIERCYSCGRSGTAARKIGDHWDSNGYKGCPRFDYSTFWNMIGGCKFRCLEGECYGADAGDCNIPEHIQGINNMIETRKRAHIYHAIKSLLPELRKQILEKLWLTNNDIRPYLPQCWSSDYRTYVPDILRQTVEHADKIMEGSVTVDDSTRELAQTILNKVGAACIVFETIQYPPLPPKQIKQSVLRKDYETLFERFKQRYIAKNHKSMKRATVII